MSLQNNKTSESSLLKLLATNQWWTLLNRFPGFNYDFVMVGGASLLINILGLAIPLMMLQVYDRIVPYKAIGTLNMLLWGVIIAVVIETVLRISRGYITAWLSSRFDYLVGKEALHHMFNLPLEAFDKDRTGVHLERLNAVSALRGYYGGLFLQVIFDVPFVFLYLLVVGLVGGWVVLFTLAVVAIYGMLIYKVQLKYAALRKEVQQYMDSQVDFVVESIGGIHTVKGLAAEEVLLRRYESVQQELTRRQIKLNALGAIPENYGQIFSQINMLGIIALGAGAVISGDMTVGVMTATTIIAARIMQPVQQVATFWLKKADAEHSVEQLKLLIEEEVDPNSLAGVHFPDIDGKVTFHDVTLLSEEKGPIITNLSLSIAAGESVGIYATDPAILDAVTLLMSGLKQPSSGNVAIDDFDMSLWEHSHFSGRVQILSSSGFLFQGTVMDNLTMFNHHNRYVAIEAAKLLGLDEAIADLPQGYETAVGMGGRSILSQGIIQRISFARALAVRPRLLILNRVLTGLDAESFTVFSELLEQLKGQCTMVVLRDNDTFPFALDRTFSCHGGELLPLNLQGSVSGRTKW